MNKLTKKELKFWKKYNKKLAKKYPDFKEDEYNIGVNKFIYGINRDFTSENTSFDTPNLLDIYYNREDKKYYCNIDSYGISVYDVEKIKALLKKEFEIEESLLFNENYLLILNNGVASENFIDLVYKIYIILNGIVIK